VFQANVLARVRAQARVKVRGKAEKEPMLVGAAKETHNNSSRSKAGKGNDTTTTVGTT